MFERHWSGMFVGIIKIAPNTLRRQLVSNRLHNRLCKTEDCKTSSHGREGDCINSNTIFFIYSSKSNDEYIGEIGRSLRVA